MKALEEEEKVQLLLSVEEICDAACFSIKEERWKGTDNTKLLEEKDATYAELKAKLEADPFFQKCGFFFRDFPGTENVLKLLNK